MTQNAGNQIPANCRSSRLLGCQLIEIITSVPKINWPRMTRICWHYCEVANFRSVQSADPSPYSIKLELCQVFFCPQLGSLLLFRFQQHKPLQHQGVDVGGQEAAIGLFRPAHDRLAADVEAGVDDDGAAGALVESPQQRVIAAVALLIDSLHASRIIDVR